MIYLAIFIILFYTLSFTEAFREAYLGHTVDKLGNRIRYDVKYPFISKLEKIIFLLIVSISMVYLFGYISLFFIIGVPFTIPYVHNGVYFIIRNRLNPNIFKNREDCDVELNDANDRPNFYIDSMWRKNLAVFGLFLQIIGIYFILDIV